MQCNEKRTSRRAVQDDVKHSTHKKMIAIWFPKEDCDIAIWFPKEDQDLVLQGDVKHFTHEQAATMTAAVTSWPAVA